MPQRLGPTRFGSPLPKVWQAAHFFAEVSPRLTSALASRTGSGSSAGAWSPRLAAGVLLLNRDLVARLFRRMRRKQRAGRDIEREQRQAGAENRTEDLVEFEGIHWRIGSR